MNNEEMSAAIIKSLTERNGECRAVQSFASSFGVTQTKVGLLLADMEKRGLVSKMNGARNASYYIKTAAQVEREAAVNKPKDAPKPLKIDKHRSELYAELARARAAIPSLYGDK